jgi:beta-galactosidase
MKIKILSILFFVSVYSFGKNELRNIINLNGKWDISESKTSTLPVKYTNSTVVPGLVDRTETPFDSVGFKCSKRNFYNYHRTFKLPHNLPAKALLKIHKASYGTRVFLNGREVGYNPFCFTPTLFDIREFLKPGQANDITIQIGAYLDNIPDTIPNGSDFEKIKYIAGIYDNVEIILSGYPFINNIQIAPDIKQQQIRIQAEIESDRDVPDFTLDFAVSEYKTGKKVVRGVSPIESLKKGINKIDFQVQIPDCKLWSPESPFLYKLSISTGIDSKTEHFGMRSFRFDKDNKKAYLNDKPYAMLGTNVCIHRFFEDPSRGKLPWDKKWVKKLHLKFKDMNWNCIRYCIGFPPEAWYEIADETGLLIQDEYPMWSAGTPVSFTKNAFSAEYKCWMRERWNHPCVVIWDAQNESITPKTGLALNEVRRLDLSNRPWDNGYASPQAETDCIESHPYLFMKYHQLNGQHNDEPAIGYMKEFFDTIRIPDNDPNQWSPSRQGHYNNPIIINEYDWLWINRNGTTTTLTDGVYNTLFNLKSLNENQLRTVHAENIGFLTEYWRCHRSAAAIMHFCGLGYSRASNPRGQTSDNFIDIKKLEYDPYFHKILKNKFAPLCIMIDKWDKTYPKGELTVPVYVINDLPEKWEGELTLTLKNGKNQIQRYVAKVKIEPSGQTIQEFKIKMNDQFNNQDEYEMISELVFKNEKISSSRKFRLQ